MTNTKMMVKNYLGRFQEGNEFSLGHVLVLCLISAVILGIGFWSLRKFTQLAYILFW